jgi:hypothetical protein
VDLNVCEFCVSFKKKQLVTYVASECYAGLSVCPFVSGSKKQLLQVLHENMMPVRLPATNIYSTIIAGASSTKGLQADAQW